MKNLRSNLAMAAALLVVLLATGCATSSVRMQVLVPAHISVPQDIQKLALVNRYRPAKGEGFLNVVEGALTGENIGQDRRAADAALSGLTNALAGSPRFIITRPPDELKGTGRGDWPPPVPVEEVRRICNASGSQALVTIEAFDSDTRLNCAAEVRETKDKEGNVQKYTVFVANKEVDVTVGWRMYHGQTGELLDEFRMFETVYFNAEGSTEQAAIGNLPNREGVTQEIGRVTGTNYSSRISPTWIWVSRRYYKRGSSELKVAREKIRYEDWDKAEQWWDKAIESGDQKVVGRAMYNKALAAELRGELSYALQLAEESGQTYGNKKARDYARALRFRIQEQQLLDEQMQGAPQ